MRGFSEWIEDRSGVRRISRAILDEPIRGGARFAYVLGSALVFMFLLQAATGIFLTMYYVPSADHAHASVAYIQKVVRMGNLVRGLHYYGASAVILLVVGHLTQVYVFGAYKQRRELLWIVGVVMLLLVVAFAFTGYLLPWDQEAYFGTKVGTSVAGEFPGAGEFAQRALLGGHDLTTVTLSRFFVIHIFLLPLFLILMVVVHLYFFRRAGAAGPYHNRDDSKVERFYPSQLFKDMVVILIIFVGLVILALRLPARLGPEADATSNFLARPPWYFLPLFELLKYFPGTWALLPTMVIPAVVFGLLFLLPFLDKRAERHPLRRPVAVGALALALGGAAALIAVSKYQDAENPEFSAKLQSQDEQAHTFLATPFFQQQVGRSVPINPPAVANPVSGGRPVKIYFANCVNCHGADAQGGPLAPSLVNLVKDRGLSRSFLVDYLKGHKREASPGSMPKFPQLAPDDLEAIADWLIGLDEPLTLESQTEAAPTEAAAPPSAFSDNCAMCHGDHGEGNIGPSLIGISAKPNRGQDDLVKLLANPRKFGLKDPMPASFPAVPDQQRKQIAEWLSKLKQG